MKRFLLILLFLSMIVAVNVLAWPPRKVAIEHSPKVNLYWQRLMLQTKPKVVLLGNSMLGNGVDPYLLTRLTQATTLKFTSGGSASAMWFLWLKNIIATSAYKPQWVVVFFRDHYLTQPHFRVTGRYKQVIDAYANPNELILDRLAYLNHMDPLTYFLYRYCPLFQKKQKIKKCVASAIKEISVQRLLGLGTGAANKAIKDVFRNRHMAPSLLTARQLEAERVQKSAQYDFDAQLGPSFLPYMIEIAEKNKMKLMFVRVRRRRDAQHQGEPERLKEYIKNLRDYLNGRGVALLDFTHDERIRLEYFGQGDHLSKTKGRPLFTHLLAEKMTPLLNPSR